MKKLLLPVIALLFSASAGAYEVSVGSDVIPYHFIPDNSLPQTEISKIDVVFPPMEEVELLLWNTGCPIEILSPDGVTTTLLGDWINYDAGQVISFELPLPLTEPGEYIMRIPEDNIFDDAQQMFAPEIEFSYRIVPSAENALTITPPPGAYASLSGKVNIEVKDAASIVLFHDPAVKLTSAADGKVTEYPLSLSGLTLSFDLGEESLPKGQYVAELPADALMATSSGGVELLEDALEWVYTVPSMVYDCKPEPGEVQKLWDIWVTFTEANSIDFVASSDEVKLYAPNGNAVDGIVFVMANYLYFRNDLYSMPDGKYNLVIPAGTLKVDGLVFDEEIKVTYIMNKFGAVEGIDEESPEDAVYTIDGLRLNGEPDAKGVYIRGGKKVIL